MAETRRRPGQHCPGRLDLRHLDDLAAAETRWLPAADGQTLVHGDISASNLLITDAREVFRIDWDQPACGTSWLDIADLVPHLFLAGHAPASAQRALAAVPAWRGTDPDIITSYAIAFAGYWTRMSRQPAPPSGPNLHAYQARAAYRTGWP